MLLVGKARLGGTGFADNVTDGFLQSVQQFFQVEAGHDHFAVATIYEVLRWRHFMRTKDDSGWKLNNSYRSRYARMLAENEPRLANVFEMRRLHDGSER